MSCEVSLYPLGVEDIGSLVSDFIQTLKRYNLKTSVGPMSTYITGDIEEIFKAVKTAYQQVVKQYSAIMTMKISNVCPIQ